MAATYSEELFDQIDDKLRKKKYREIARTKVDEVEA